MREDQAALVKCVQDYLATVSLGGFILATFPKYELGWVHEEICNKLDDFLDDVVAGKSPRLMLMMPPRSGKTEIVSRRFPAYLLGKYPELSIIAASYSADLASRNNLDIQRIIDTPEYRNIFPGTLLPNPGIKSDKRRTSGIFEVVGHGGSYRSTGVGGGVTGMGANILIIDDPIKDRQEADSAVTRERVYDWYTSTAYTRLEPGGGVLLIMTRWHTADLCGRLLEEMRTGGEKWEVIAYPAIAVRDELHRKEGEALHPERYNLEHLLKTKRTIGSRDWEAMYQQHPVAEGGNVFKEDWLRYYTVAPKCQQIVQSWDMTFKDGPDTDFVVGQVWGRKGADYYLLDQVRGRLDFTQSLRAVVKLSQKWPRATKKMIEDKANGPAIMNALKHDINGLVPVEPNGSKTSRAYAVTPLFESGNVYLPDPSIAPWITDYVAELLQFPAGAHDDQVDATTQALSQMEKHQKMIINPLILRAI